MMMKNLNNKKIFVIAIIFLTLFSVKLWSAPASVLETYNKALELESNEDWYEASQFFMEVVNENSAFTDAWFRLSSCCYKLGEYDLALQYLSEAEKYEKLNSNIQNLKGMIYLALGQIDTAKEIFKQVLIKYPNDIDSHFGLAEIELYDGKFSGAELQYTEALKRQNSNRKALLSLALVCAQTGRFTQAENYLRQAMQFYSGESQLHYLAAIIYIMKGDYKKAEQHAKISVEIDGDFEKGYELISSVLYLQNRYQEVIDISDFLISRNRNNSLAWYVKGIAQIKMNLEDEALQTWSTGLKINPQDEFMRWQLELICRKNLGFNDARRKEWALYHVENASQYQTRYDKAGASYEYQRAILLDPKNQKARLEYANMLEMDGLHEMYLNQLSFIQKSSEDALDVNMKDTIEAYNSLLYDTLAKQWKIDTFYLDKIRWNIAIFYEENNNNASLYHVDSNRILAQAASDIFSGVAITSVKTQITPISGFSEAFKNARKNNFDYFIIINSVEGQDDIILNATMYSGRTGTETFKESYYSTGNNRLSLVLRRFRNSVLEKLTVKGKILARNGKLLLVDLGKVENISDGAEFKIIKKGAIKTADSGIGLFYKDSDVLGNLVISKTGEEVSEALITEHGFYDKINVGDEIVLVKLQKEDDSVIDNVPNSDEEGNTIVKNQVQEVEENKKLMDELKNNVNRPAILDLLRSIN